MKISYVLPVRNEQNRISGTINSLLKQKIKPHEIIVLDDNSKDNTLRILKFYGKNIILKVSDTRQGAAKLRNIGNKLATGDVIAVCDAEYYMPHRSLAIQTFFNTFKDKHMFHSSVKCVDTMGREWIQEATEWDFKSKCPVSHPTLAYRKEVTQAIEYPEVSPETDLFELFLIEANKKGFALGGCVQTTCVKMEGNTNRDKSIAWGIKKEMYQKEGIEI